jgi:hypothetical protein
MQNCKYQLRASPGVIGKRGGLPIPESYLDVRLMEGVRDLAQTCGRLGDHTCVGSSPPRFRRSTGRNHNQYRPVAIV